MARRKRVRLVEVEVSGRHYRPFDGTWHAEGTVTFDSTPVAFTADREDGAWSVTMEKVKGYDAHSVAEARRLVTTALEEERKFVSLELKTKAKRVTRQLLVEKHVEEKVKLAHGGGGTLMLGLIRDLFLPLLGGKVLSRLEDAAVIRVGGERLAFTTDSYVVRPLFFPGGDIGRLAVAGTVNDLATGGARAKALSIGLIVEEGFPLADLKRIIESVAATAKEARVHVVTGDTKVVERGAADGVYINSAGVGLVPQGVHPSPHKARPGDAVIVTGTIGDHGIAVMSRRKGMAFDVDVVSDVAPLGAMTAGLLERFGADVRCLKDPTRGGLAAALNEIAEQSGVQIEMDEARIPIRAGVISACEMLGFDPLLVANEGKMVVVARGRSAADVVKYLRRRREARQAAVVGRVVARGAPRVAMRTAIGGIRIVDMPYGEQLPRIC